jgi:hypothetical protein
MAPPSVEMPTTCPLTVGLIPASAETPLDPLLEPELPPLDPEPLPPLDPELPELEVLAVPLLLPDPAPLLAPLLLPPLELEPPGALGELLLLHDATDSVPVPSAALTTKRPTDVLPFNMCFAPPGFAPEPGQRSNRPSYEKLSRVSSALAFGVRARPHRAFDCDNRRGASVDQHRKRAPGPGVPDRPVGFVAEGGAWTELSAYLGRFPDCNCGLSSIAQAQMTIDV